MVLRNGELKEIETAEIVPGDLLRIEEVSCTFKTVDMQF